MWFRSDVVCLSLRSLSTVFGDRSYLLGSSKMTCTSILCCSMWVELRSNTLLFSVGGASNTLLFSVGGASNTLGFNVGGTSNTLGFNVGGTSNTLLFSGWS